jgi:hypothetical protein
VAHPITSGSPNYNSIPNLQKSNSPDTQNNIQWITHSIHRKTTLSTPKEKGAIGAFFFIGISKNPSNYL